MLQVNTKTGEVIFTHIHKLARPTVGQERGSMIIQNYGFQYDEKLRKDVLVPTDTYDMQEYINSFAEEADVYSILKKYAKTGDPSVINNKEGFYADISGMGDQLDPAKARKLADKAVAELKTRLGAEITTQDLMTMSSEDLNALILKAAQAKATIEANKTSEKEVDNVVKKEGE